MKYSIITPTYNRPDLLKRSIDSVLNQRNQNDFDWEMIIVNDSPLFDYTEVEKYLTDINDTKLKYLKNQKNIGVNYSRNFALNNISTDSDYIIFLDDDDHLNDDAIFEINKIIKSYLNENKKETTWLATNRLKENQESITKLKNKDIKLYSYLCDYLIFKKISGDATHTIKSSVIKKNKITFSQYIKNGEEWLFFIKIPEKFIYKNLNSTISGGYLEDGLTEDLKNKYKTNTKILWKEIINNKKLILNFKILIYMIMRSIRNFINI